MLEALRQTKNRVVGAKQVTRALEEGTLAKLFVAEDADLFVTRKIMDLAQQRGIALEKVETMAQLGAACQIEVGAAVAGILK